MQTLEGKDLEANKHKIILEALEALRTSRRKAANLLFEEIEHDIIDKEKFVIEQTGKIREMNESYLTMLDYEKVLENVQILLPSIREGSIGGGRGSLYGIEGSKDGGLEESKDIDVIDKQPLIDDHHSVS